MIDKCPCENCICVPMCINRKIIPSIRNCSLIFSYLVKRESSGTTVLHKERLHEYCCIMKIRLEKVYKGTKMTYHWEK